ncbi:glycoside hydrolase family 3 C-terminal domain-containing protein [Halalkalibacter akibai]|uniref:Beta-glucosidase n=1 Tax=Halalkalibacter akibai (strain ATCC 43226 / DSM 21942 / CIP 109018 / JCM 9157 / 1139) TaxID=1236973 RepID=W4QVT4_HALA3|nr:glycoside hydrolase family 3 C-terminal domain-containing protein [Halalkalibacter akibai]GAE36002.1 beta-glucosidase [Halalkalibacter akibai JCM 9157]
MQKSPVKRFGKRCLLAFLGLTLVSTSFQPVGFATERQEQGVSFKTQSGGVFDGMPLFDGNPEHLDEYVDTYFEYTGLEGPAVYATGSRNHYTLQRGKHAGKVIPGALSAADNVQGISTDFPALVGMGQTWNKQLLTDIGKVMGSEKLNTLKVKQGESNIHGGPNASPTVAFTVETDLRINPLSGRFDEGYSEDAYLTSVLVDNMAAGLGGTDLPESNDGFWMRAAVGTKHYSVYNSQWYRFSASYLAGARAQYEYQTRAALLPLSTGSVSGVMTSFGRTNGVPNILSPLQLHANNYAKYGVYSSPDFNADAHVFGPETSAGRVQQGNGYDQTYAVDRTHATALMVLAKSNAGRPSPNPQDALTDVLGLVDAVEQGLYGLSKEDLIEAARPHVNQMVRVGIFNEVDEEGIPKYYPFAQYAKDVATTPSNYHIPEHQDIALQAAKESIVLLKNDGALPLNKNENASISGIYADARFKPTASLRVTPEITNSGISPLSAIIRKIGGDRISYHTGAPIIGLSSKLLDQTVTANANAGAEGSVLQTTEEPLNSNDPAHLFEQYDWGQEGHSLRSILNERWVTSPNAGNVALGNTDNTILNITSNDWSQELLLGNTSTIPPRLRIEQNEDQSVSIISNGFRTGFTGEFSNWYYLNGRMITTSDKGNLVTSTSTLNNATNAAIRDDRSKFEKTIIRKAGEDVVERASVDDYAVVFVGAIPRHSAGEGNDRSSLYMGETDYELVERVSEAFAAQGKKTVVVVTSSFPVALDKIENNPNVNAIIYQPYAGQYDSVALAEVLYGDYAPTGRLTSTWYADMSALPSLSKYSIPEGNSTDVVGVNIDPRYTVDMLNSDPIDTKLTYMYTEAPVTYEFGHGLSYSEFGFSDFTVPTEADSKKTFNVTVNVTNTGEVKTSEVIQLYIKNNNSAYKNYAPKKQLVSFDKVEIEPGETRTVTLSVNPQDFAVWDVNLGDFIVEENQYTLMVGSSSENIKEEQKIKVKGSSIATLQADTFNVFDHSFSSHEVVYHEVSKGRTAANLKENKVVGGYHAVRSKQEGSWVAIPNVKLSNAKEVTARVATDVKSGQISLHLGSPDSKPIAEINVPVTGPNSYTVDHTNVTVNELGYVDVTTKLTGNTQETKDLYVVFHEADLRIDSLTFTKPGNSNPPGKREEPGKPEHAGRP